SLQVSQTAPRESTDQGVSRVRLVYGSQLLAILWPGRDYTRPPTLDAIKILKTQGGIMNGYTLLWCLIWQSIYFAMFLYYFIPFATGANK
ncbi:hypothetical protein ACSYAD_33505, partial [Acaryochloris marina NIES-2412]|uniref:hypothetical protein n=1 Tax=Acaryochloris marina TaxID=155978 RepID=UPI00405A48F0